MKSQTPNKPSDLANYVKRAATQRLHIDSWVEDYIFKNKGGTVFYSVDTNVVKFYSSPVETSLQRGQRDGYAEIFPSDPEELIIALGKVLSTYIFFHAVNPERPALILPPLERELGSIFGKVALRASSEHDQAELELDKLKNLKEELKKHRDDEARLAEILAKATPTLAQLLKGLSGPSAELQRLSRLIEDKRIVSAERVLDLARTEFKAIADVLAPIEGVRALYEYTALKHEWADRLKEVRPGSKASELIENDAEAMARLEWMNAQLDGKRFRIVHITGDHGLYKAAEEYAIEDGVSFADRYLRHPRSFLGARAIVPGPDGMPDDRNNELVDLLDVLLAKRSNTHTVPGRLELKKIAVEASGKLASDLAPVLQKSPDLVQDFVGKWRHLATNVAAKYLPSELISEDFGLSGRQAADLTEIEEIAEKARSKLDQKIVETWSACFSAVTMAGFDILTLRKRPAKLRPRNAPALYFDSFKEAESFIKEALHDRHSDPINHHKYKDLLERLNKEDNNSGYLYYLCFAYLFASAGRWSVSVILSNRALRAAEKSGHKHVSGREAAYLKAVALRHCIVRASDLGKCEQAMDAVDDRLRIDVEGRPRLDVWPIRFRGERLAIALTYHLFDKFSMDCPDRGKLRPLAEIQSDLEAEYGRIPQNMKNWVRVNVERNLLINIFNCAFLRHFKNGEPMDPATLTGYLSDLKNSVNRKEADAAQPSYLVETVADVADWWLGSDRERKSIAARLMQKLSDSNISDAIVMPYDKARYGFYRDLIGTRER